MAEALKVLSIDGGGIRGIIPAMILAEIEDRTGGILGRSSGGFVLVNLDVRSDR